MPVTIVVNNVYSRLMGDVSDVVSYYLSEQLSYKIEDVRHIIKAMYGVYPERTSGDQWDGVVKLYWKEKGHMFFTGMMAEVRKILKSCKEDFVIDDRRICPEQNLPDLKFDPKDMEYRPYEEISVQQMLKATRGILQAATGAGKTFMVTDLIGRIKTAPFLFMVLSKDLMEQAHETLSRHLGVPIGMVGDGVVDIQGINVVMMQTAVKALHWDDKKFDPSTYKFDEEEDWDDDTVEKTSKGEDIKRLITGCKGIYLDEAHHAASRTAQELMETSKDAYWRFGGSVGPQSFVEMKGGCFGSGFVGGIENAFEMASHVSIPYAWKEFEVVDLDGVMARGWNGESFAWKNCLRILRHSGTKCITLNIRGANLLITPDHSVYYATANESDRVMRHKKPCFEANIDGVSALQLKQGDILIGDDGTEFGGGDGTSIDMIEFCQKYMQNSKIMVHCNVKSIDRNVLKRFGDSKSVYNWRSRKSLPLDVFLKIKNAPDAERLTQHKHSCWIAPKINLANWAYILGFYLGDGWVPSNKRLSFAVGTSQSNSIIKKLTSLEGVGWRIKKRTMPGKSVELRASNIFVANILLSVLGVVRCHNKFIPGDWIVNWSKEKRMDLLCGLLDSDGCVHISSGNREYHAITTTSLFLAKGIASLLRSLNLWAGFYSKKPKNGGKIAGRQIIARRLCYVVRWSRHREGLARSGKRNHFLHRKKTFSEAPLRKISSGATPKFIYDLEMSGHPSFVADGILVHNSATPFREDGAEKMIQALFGKVLVNISASWLIQNKYLVKPCIFNISIKEDKGDWKSWPQVYKHHIADNASLNDLVVRIEQHLKVLGIPLLVLVQRYPHGDALADRTGLVFIKGKMPRKRRREAIQELRDGKITGAIATTLADEGLDVKRLGAVAVAGGGKSITRVYQRVGRTLRTFPGKERALVFLFHHKCKYLDNHGIRVRHILRQEQEFVLMESTPESIIEDIDHIVRPTKGLFDD